MLSLFPHICEANTICLYHKYGGHYQFPPQSTCLHGGCTAEDLRANWQDSLPSILQVTLSDQLLHVHEKHQSHLLAPQLATIKTFIAQYKFSFKNRTAWVFGHPVTDVTIKMSGRRDKSTHKLSLNFIWNCQKPLSFSSKDQLDLNLQYTITRLHASSNQAHCHLAKGSNFCQFWYSPYLISSMHVACAMLN